MFLHFPSLSVLVSMHYKKQLSLPVLKKWRRVEEPYGSTLPLLSVCLSNLCDCPSSLFYFQWFPRVEDVLKPVNVPEERISLSSELQTHEKKPDPQAAALQECKCIQSGGDCKCKPALPI